MKILGRFAPFQLLSTLPKVEPNILIIRKLFSINIYRTNECLPNHNFKCEILISSVFHYLLRYVNLYLSSRYIVCESTLIHSTISTANNGKWNMIATRSLWKQWIYSYLYMSITASRLYIKLCKLHVVSSIDSNYDTTSIVRVE